MKEKEELYKKKQVLLLLNKVQKSSSKLGMKQKKLDSDVAETKKEMNIAKRLLEDANNTFEQAISEGNMMKVRITR